MICTPYFSSDQVKNNEMGGHIACMGERRSAHRLLVGKPEGMRSLGRPRHRWVDNIKMDLQEVGWGGRHGLD